MLIIFACLIYSFTYSLWLHRPASMSLGKDNNGLCSYSEDGNKVRMLCIDIVTHVLYNGFLPIDPRNPNIPVHCTFLLHKFSTVCVKVSSCL